NGAVLLDDALVLDGHLPPRERHHPCAELDVAVVERSPQERLRHARAILVTDGLTPPPEETDRGSNERAAFGRARGSARGWRTHHRDLPRLNVRQHVQPA